MQDLKSAEGLLAAARDVIQGFARYHELDVEEQRVLEALKKYLRKKRPAGAHAQSVKLSAFDIAPIRRQLAKVREAMPSRALPLGHPAGTGSAESERHYYKHEAIWGGVEEALADLEERFLLE